MKTVTLKEVSDFRELPAIGMRIYNPKFREQKLEEAFNSIRAEEEWIPYGFNYFILCRSTSEFHCYYSIETKVN